MLVFIDESGDPGFKLEKGSSAIFAVAMVIFESGEAARATEEAINECAKRIYRRQEFKFASCTIKDRDAFFHCVRRCQFKIRAIIVQKSIIYSPNLQTSKNAFYSFFVKQMVEHDDDTLKEAKLIIDGSGNREFRKNLKVYLRRNRKPGAISDIRMQNSKNDRLIQLADMCVGAIARSYKPDVKHSNRWREKIKHLIDDVWDFS